MVSQIHTLSYLLQLKLIMGSVGHKLGLYLILHRTCNSMFTKIPGQTAWAQELQPLYSLIEWLTSIFYQ